jgi:hypothetical protein
MNTTTAKQNIFDLRLQSARANLDALNASVDTIKSRNTHLSELQGKLALETSAIAKALRGLRKHIESAAEHAKDMADEYAKDSVGEPSVVIEARGAAQYLNQLTDLLKAAMKQANEIRVLQLAPQLLKDRNFEFNTKVRLGTVRLDQIVGAAKSSNNKRWDELKELGSVWGEYLDYLAGLSLRHDGLDAGVCDIADDLIQELHLLSQAELAALAIPGREGCDGILPKIVYLRFPEWTVWALPLAAHELWHIVEAGDSVILAIFKNAVADREIENVERSEKIDLRECLADAFATYTMGPAYAWSCVVLVLNPDDQFRAQCIFRTLRHLNKKNESYGVLQNVLDQLDELWTEAMREAGVRPEPLPHHFERWIDALIHSLDISPLSFPTESWIPFVRPLAKELQDITIPVEDIDIKQMNLRLALSASWQTRIDSPPEISLKTFKEITERCTRLCMRVGKRKPFNPPRDPTGAGMHNMSY